ncbi:MAG TPA: DUF3761 domain-containing protein [Pyrinomonadaceae bacterium]
MKKNALISLLLVLLFACACAMPRDAVSFATQPLPTPTATAKKPKTLAVVKAVKANLRSRPSTSAKVVGTLNRGSEVALVVDERVGPWFKVHDNSTGLEGWLHGDLITLKKAPPETTTSKAAKRKSGKSYINVDGIRVPSPVFTDKRPAGASARCRDGSYSFSLHRQGTCSHHGGVAGWF